MTDTDGMVLWLREAMDAAQRDAEAADGAEWSVEDLRIIDQRDGVSIETGREPGTVLIGNGLRIGSGVPAALAHVARHSPAAVLRRIAADRKILEAHPHTTRVITGYGQHTAGFGCENCHNWDGVPEGRGNCEMILALAEGYGWAEGTT